MKRKTKCPTKKKGAKSSAALVEVCKRIMKICIGTEVETIQCSIWNILYISSHIYVYE